MPRPRSLAYTAFLSYSHAADAAVATAIQTALHRFAKPWYRRRAMRVFRDKTSLAASPALWPSLEQALGDSEFLVLLASPTSAQSPWIQREVGWWLAHRSIDTLLVVLTAGDIVWDESAGDFDWERTTALPRTMTGALANEPLYVDVRWAAAGESLSLRHARFRDAILDLASALRHASKDELDGEDVRQFRRTRRMAWSGVTLLAVLAVAASLAAWYALRQRDLAEARTLAARSSLAIAENNVELGALLAVEAMRRRPSLESDNAIRRALDLLATPVASRHGSEPVDYIAVDASGRRVVIGGPQRLVVWDSASRRLVPLDSKTPVQFAAIAGDGPRVLVVDADGAVDVWEADGRRRRPDREGRPAAAAALSRDGRWGVLLDAAGTGDLWNIDSGLTRRLAMPALPETVDGRIAAVAVSSDGARVMVARAGRTWIWKAGVEREHSPAYRFEAVTVALPREAPRIVTSEYGTKAIDVWDADSGQRLGRMTSDFTVSGLMASATGERVLARGADGDAIGVWDVDSRRPVGFAHAWGVNYRSLAISDDGGRVVTGGQDGVVRVWAVTGEQVVRLGGGHENTARAIGVSGDGSRLLVRDEDGGIRLVEAAAGRDVWRWRGASAPRHAQVSGDGRHVLVAAADGTSLAIAVDGGADVRPVMLPGPADEIAMGVDGRRAVAVDQISAGVINQASARIWAADTGRVLTTVPLPVRVTRAAISGGGERLVVGHQATLWALILDGWRQRTVEFEARRDVRAVCISPDGSLVAFIGSDGVLQVWEIDGRTELLHLGGQQAVDAMAFRPDGRALLTVERTARGTVARQRLLRPADLVVEVCARIARNLTEQEWREHIGAGSPRPSCSQAR